MIITGTDNNEGLTGTDGKDKIRALGGNDFVDAKAGSDKVRGGAGNDQIDGGRGHDELHGDDGADTMFGRVGDDTLAGGAGDDSLWGGSGHDVISGDDGFDIAAFEGDGVSLSLLIQEQWQEIPSGEVWLTGVEGLYGTYGSDRLIGDAGDNYLSGGSWVGLDGEMAEGDDVLRGGDGNDVLSLNARGNATVAGGGGRDKIDFLGSHDGILASLQANQIFKYGTLALVGVEDLGGTYYRDHLTGDDRANLLDGNVDADSLHGGGGGDTLIGGLGDDELTGGAGRDHFVFGLEYLGAYDVIVDLTAGDVVDFSRMDARDEVAGDQAFVLVEAFSGQTGEAMIVYDEPTDSTQIRLSVSIMGGTVDAVVGIYGNHLDFTNFVW
jgi:Ca2+-binding RTX toxin-like protein